ncbi:hypothetical protein [Kribbella pittospori]|nr:hypothetical protein [Kribbella pittospori]
MKALVRSIRVRSTGRRSIEEAPKRIRRTGYATVDDEAQVIPRKLHSVLD